jgi:leader peptidase (prepilin peptidase)/N-methyltransferase
LGFGDVKLAAAAGAWTGLDGLPITLLLASGSALLAILVHGMLRPGERATPTTRIPFGSFLAPAIIVTWVLTYPDLY